GEAFEGMPQLCGGGGVGEPFGVAQLEEEPEAGREAGQVGEELFFLVGGIVLAELQENRAKVLAECGDAFQERVRKYGCIAEITVMAAGLRELGAEPEIRSLCFGCPLPGLLGPVYFIMRGIQLYGIK